MNKFNFILQEDETIDILKRQGFFLIKELENGKFRAQYGKTTYYNLYVENNIVKQA